MDLEKDIILFVPGRRKCTRPLQKKRSAKMKCGIAS